ncbi:hypothetical protein LW983_17470, partial [Erwinia amylovora]|uniref:hypothetical protein n=1 Tax=Erwinia amylovora TaxID=552 RepID=UPI0020C0CAB5
VVISRQRQSVWYIHIRSTGFGPVPGSYDSQPGKKFSSTKNLSDYSNQRRHFAELSSQEGSIEASLFTAGRSQLAS